MILYGSTIWSAKSTGLAMRVSALKSVYGKCIGVILLLKKINEITMLAHKKPQLHYIFFEKIHVVWFHADCPQQKSSNKSVPFVKNNGNILRAMFQRTQWFSESGECSGSGLQQEEWMVFLDWRDLRSFSVWMEIGTYIWGIIQQ